MKKKAYIVSNTIACGMILSEIAHGIPCFMDFESEEDLTEPYMSIIIECREADLPWVEQMLAPYV